MSFLQTLGYVGTSPSRFAGLSGPAAHKAYVMQGNIWLLAFVFLFNLTIFSFIKFRREKNAKN